MPHPTPERRTQVVNVRVDEFDVYIGRTMPGRPGGRFANPFKTTGEASRASVIAQYRQRIVELLARDPTLRAELEALRGKRLGCWCRPKACHGDVLVELLEGPPVVEPPAQPSLF